MLLSELEMSNYVGKNYDDGNKFKGQIKNGNLNGFDIYYWAVGSKYVV